MKKKSVGSTLFDSINIVIMLFVVIITLYPFVYVASVSISDLYAVKTNKVFLYPIGFSTEAYRRILQDPRILGSYWNTIQYTSVGTLFNVVFTSLMAYGLAKKSLTWRRPILLVVSFTMLFSGGLIPTYLLVMKLGLIDKIWAIVFPSLISTWNLMVMRTFFEGIPESLSESAYIDGSNEMQTFLWIIVPLSKPIFLTMGLFYAVDHWNSFFSALIYMNTPSKFPLQIILRNMVIGNSMTLADDTAAGIYGITEESMKTAVIMVAVLPILFIYPFIQKYFVKGVMVGAIKG